MKSGIIKLLTFGVFSLAIAGQISPPVQAATQGDKATKNYSDDELKEFESLPNSAKAVVIITSFFISGAGVIVGTGHSIKYEKESAKNDEV